VPLIREDVNEARIAQFVDALSKVVNEETNLYLTGGAAAVIYGWRPSTADIDAADFRKRVEFVQSGQDR
jgi:hypothetical protein